ncbi:hypothetical protein TNCV_2540851 [Trichonephila clavipes]|nr:hypothetical protein TNCV_2540851 [Trichonephila clavipes]
MINEPVKPHHAVLFWGMQWLLCVLTWIRGRPNGTVMVVNVTMKREMKASSVHKMLKTQVGSCSILERPTSQMLPSVLYLLAKVHGMIAICMGTAGGFDEEYCGQMMVVKPNRLAVSRALRSLKLLRTQSLPFRPQCRVRASFKHGRPARARSSNFPVSSKRLTSFKETCRC